MNVLQSIVNACNGGKVQVIQSDRVNSNELEIGSIGIIIGERSFDPISFEVYFPATHKVFELLATDLEFSTKK